MGKRRVLVLTLLAAAGGLSVTAYAATKGKYTAKGFSHKAHMHASLKDPTSLLGARECMECHGERDVQGERVMTRFDACAECHQKGDPVPGQAGRFFVGYEVEKVTTEKRKETVSFVRFNHTAHRDWACAKCHAFDAKSDTFHMPKDALTTLCVECHADHDTKKPWFQGNCASCHFDEVITQLDDPRAGVAERKGKFNHRVHLPKDRMRGEDCAVCHVGVATSKDLLNKDVGGVTAAACAKCHIAAKGEPAIKIEPVYVKKERFYTEFDHKAHARNFDCTKCHTLGQDGTYEWAIPGLPTYKGCIECHGTWRVKDHGRVIQCGQCHNEDDSLRVEEVTKSDLGALSFGTVHHPFIQPGELGRSAGGSAQDCSTCHVRARTDIPSRIEGQVFSHKAHLGGKVAKEAADGFFPSDRSCLACHGLLRKSQAPATSKRFDLVKDCAGCHKGDPPTAQPSYRKVAVAHFSHEDHLKSTNPAIRGCVSCHSYDGEADRMLVPKDVMSCVRCHDHTHKADVTGQDLNKCVHCHTGGSLHRKTEKLTVEFERLGAVSFPRQEHDQSRRCAECHAPRGGFQVDRTKVVESAHNNVGHFQIAVYKKKKCVECHFDQRKE